MLFLSIFFVILFTLVSTNPLDNQSIPKNGTYNIKAVLVAGSKGIGNYRHQSDVCHAYHVLRNHGVAAEDIIVMMYDDIAKNRENPEKGKIFNKPDGPDVYEGVSKDYTGKEVTPKNFLKVLKGDTELAASGKRVLNSGPNDHVFIYFADHGATGLLAFPSGILSSKDLNEGLIYMNKHKLYNKLTFYVEACESGSMFEHILPKNINIFVTTAANPSESSWGAYCDTPGKFDGICLGDEYSVAWMEDSDKQDLASETLQQQFQHVLKSVKNSHPQEYGQKSLGNLDVGEFQGEQESQVNLYQPINITGQVDSREAHLHMLRRQMITSNNATHIDNLKRQLTSVTAGRQYLQRTVTKVISKLCSTGFCTSAQQVLAVRKPLTDHTTYDKVAKNIHANCFNLSDHSDGLRYMYAFANIVEDNKFNGKRLAKFLKTLEKACRRHFADNQFEAIV